MFHISSDIEIKSPLRFPEVATVISHVLEIPPFTKESFGRWEGADILISRCFGLQFTLSKAKPATGASELFEYGLSVDSNFETPREGAEITIDATRYTLLLLRGCPDLEATAG